jgi:hypothetical protein
MIGAILFAVIPYVITTELWLFVTRQRAAASRRSAMIALILTRPVDKKG